jgi:hypothetical protein
MPAIRASITLLVWSTSAHSFITKAESDAAANGVTGAYAVAAYA